jgi:hypothetical protein
MSKWKQYDANPFTFQLSQPRPDERAGGIVAADVNNDGLLEGALRGICNLLGRDMGWQGRAAPTDAHDVGRLQILRNAPVAGLSLPRARQRRRV